MNRFVTRLTVAVIVAATFSDRIAAAEAVDSTPFDFNQPQSPVRPAPAWLKLIDQGKTDARFKGYVTPEGIKIEIVADAPTVINPVGMTFGKDGTLYVLEWPPYGSNQWHEFPEEFTYKDGTKRKVATMKKPIKDLVKVLSSTKNDGVYDKAEVIIEDELPSSILVHDGWIYLSGRGTVRRYRQSKPGGPYDVKEIIAQGFCGFHHHQVSGMTIGLDGWLYITSGDDDNYVEGSDGSRATVLRTGAIFRCRPDGSRLHEYSRGYRNPYRDVAFDSVYNIFHVDNDNEDGSKFTGCRFMHVAEDSDFGWRLFTGARCCRPDHTRGAIYGELPGKVPPMIKTGRGSPAGLLIYNDSRFPENYRGLMFYPDVYRKLIRAYRVEPIGSSFQVVEEFEFMKSDDPLFRPCQMVVGPDGAMYICDWRTDSGGAGRLSGDGQHGRIYRLSWVGVPKSETKPPVAAEDQAPALPLRGLDSWAKIGMLFDEQLVKLLGADDFTDRQIARREIVARGRRFIPLLTKLLHDNRQTLPVRMEALGALQAFWSPQVEEAIIKSFELTDEPSLRRAAAEAIGLNSQPGDVVAHNGLLKYLGDEDGAVRRAVALALGRVNAPAAADALVNAYKFDDRKDVYLSDGLIRAVERTGKPGIEKLIALAESGVDEDREKVVHAFEALRIRAGYEALPGFLKDPHLTIEQRARLIHSYGNYLFDSPVSFEPVVSFLSEDADEATPIKLAALRILSLPGAVASATSRDAVLRQLKDSEPEVRLLGIKCVDDNRLTKAAPQLAKLLGNEKAAAPERAAIIKALRVLNDKSAVPELQAILKPSAEETTELTALRLEALRTLAALDAEAGRTTAAAFLDAKQPLLQTEAVTMLGTQAAGAKLVGERFLEKKLPRDLLPQVTEALSKHAGKDPALAKLLADIMKGGLLVGLDKSEIERVNKLVKTKGSAKRGKQLFLNSKSLACINCHRLEGIGGNVGPDLTRLWDTHSVEKIMESMIEPSKEIKEGYQSYIATTKNDQIYTGLKLSQDAKEVVLREANGNDVRIAAKDLDTLVVDKKSLMPDNVISQLSFDQFIDLVAFLKSRDEQESLRGISTGFWVVGPFGEDLKTVYPPEQKPDPAEVYPSADGKAKLAWQQVATEPSGLLNLTALLHVEHASAYALTYMHSPKEQKVMLLTGSDDTLRVWINGALVHEHATPRAAKPDDDHIEVKLKEGWNTVLAKVVNGVADHHLYLRFMGGEGLRVALKPEGK